MIRLVSGLVLLALLALSARRAAAAPEIEPATGDPFRREGFSAGVALGPQVFIGAPGLSGVVGLGGGLSLRVGTWGGEHLQWLAELVTGGFLVRRTDIAGEQSTTYSANSALTLGAQYYVKSAVWLRLGFGLAGQGVREGDQTGDLIDERGGLAMVSGAGIDLFRQGILAFDLEAVVVSSAFKGDTVGQGGLLLGINWY